MCYTLFLIILPDVFAGLLDKISLRKEGLMFLLSSYFFFVYVECLLPDVLRLRSALGMMIGTFMSQPNEPVYK